MGCPNVERSCIKTADALVMVLLLQLYWRKRAIIDTTGNQNVAAGANQWLRGIDKAVEVIVEDLKAPKQDIW